MKYKSIVIGLLIMLGMPPLYGVDLSVTEEYFNEGIVTFYLSDFDLENPENNQLIFNYRIGENGTSNCIFPEPIMVSFEFTLKAKIFSLGWSDYRNIATVTINPFLLNGSMTISNQLLGTNVDETMVHYECPQAGAYVDMNGGTASINSESLSLISNMVLATNQLPGGSYSFIFTVYNESEGGAATITRDISIISPTTLQLFSPGNNTEASGEFGQIFTKYPVFQWESESCGSCDYFIRICKYDPTIHNSPLSAMQDESVLPFPDDGLFFNLGNNINIYNYDPSTQGLELEFGSSYVWQIKKSFSTSAGSSDVMSEIFGFTTLDPSGDNMGTGIPTDPVSNIIKQVIGDDRFTMYFSNDGDLSGYISNGTITLNGETISISDLEMIRNGFENGSYSIQNISVE